MKSFRRVLTARRLRVQYTRFTSPSGGGRPAQRDGWGSGTHDCRRHAMQILKHVVILEPKYAIAKGIEVCRSLVVMGNAFSRSVLRSIEFDDEVRSLAYEVCDVRHNWRLAAEVEALGL